MPITASGSTIAKRVAFYHAALFSPALSTWCAAIDAGLLATWPALTLVQVQRHLQTPPATHFGHLDQTRCNQNSTKPQLELPPDPIVSPPSFPTPQPTDPLPLRSHHLYADCQEVTGRIHTDQTGHFIAPSSKGSKYILVLYEYDSNYILAEPLPS
jgi:hypothetical protein